MTPGRAFVDLRPDPRRTDVHLGQQSAQFAVDLIMLNDAARQFLFDPIQTIDRVTGLTDGGWFGGTGRSC
jgi:hypothetical protein